MTITSSVGKLQQKPSHHKAVCEESLNENYFLCFKISHLVAEIIISIATMTGAGWPIERNYFLCFKIAYLVAEIIISIATITGAEWSVEKASTRAPAIPD